MMDFEIITFTFVLFIAFIGMSAYALYINDDWAREYEKLSNEWFEIATAHSNSWAKLCSKIADENTRLKKRIKELEAERVIESED